MRVLSLLGVAMLAAGCGVPQDYVKQETRAMFDNAVSVTSHVKLACAAQASSTDCKEAADKLSAVCQSLDELDRKAGGVGFDCTAWKVKQ